MKDNAPLERNTLAEAGTCWKCGNITYFGMRHDCPTGLVVPVPSGINVPAAATPVDQNSCIDAALMMAPTLDKPDASISKELIRALAMEIGAGAVAYVEVMYPEAIKAASSTFKLSLRNHIHNAIVSIAELHDEPAIKARLLKDAAFRKKWVGMYRKMRRAKK